MNTIKLGNATLGSQLYGFMMMRYRDTEMHGTARQDFKFSGRQSRDEAVSQTALVTVLIDCTILGYFGKTMVREHHKLARESEWGIERRKNWECTSKYHL